MYSVVLLHSTLKKNSSHRRELEAIEVIGLTIVLYRRRLCVNGNECECCTEVKKKVNGCTAHNEEFNQHYINQMSQKIVPPNIWWHKRFLQQSASIQRRNIGLFLILCIFIRRPMKCSLYERCHAIYEMTVWFKMWLENSAVYNHAVRNVVLGILFLRHETFAAVKFSFLSV